MNFTFFMHIIKLINKIQQTDKHLAGNTKSNPLMPQQSLNDYQFQLIPPQMKQFLKDNTNYHKYFSQFHKIFKKISQHYYPPHPSTSSKIISTTSLSRKVSHLFIKEIIHIMIAFKNMLSDRNQNPYSKLLIMRFIKHHLLYPNYAYVGLLICYMFTVLMKDAVYAKQLKRDDRGQSMFLKFVHSQNNSSLKYNEEYVKIIGLSYLQIILETYQALSSIIKYWPYNIPEQPKIISAAFRHYEILVSLDVKFPMKNTYYKIQDKQKLSKAYSKILEKSQYQPEYFEKQIDDFYDILIDSIFDTKTTEIFRSQYIEIIRCLVISGDTNCMKKLAPILSDHISSQQIGQDILESSPNLKNKQNQQAQNKLFEEIAIKMCDKLFMTGNLYTIYMIQKHLLHPLLTNFIHRKYAYQNRQLLYNWGNLLSQQAGYQKFVKILIEISQSLYVCEPNINKKGSQNISYLRQQFKNNCLSQKYLNQSTLTYLKQTHDIYEQQQFFSTIQKLMANYMQNKKKYQSPYKPSPRIIVHEPQPKQQMKLKQIQFARFHEDIIKSNRMAAEQNQQLDNIDVKIDQDYQNVIQSFYDTVKLSELKNLERKITRKKKDEQELVLKKTVSKYVDDDELKESYIKRQLNFMSLSEKVSTPSNRDRMSTPSNRNSSKGKRKGISLVKSLTQSNQPFFPKKSTALKLNSKITEQSIVGSNTKNDSQVQYLQHKLSAYKKREEQLQAIIKQKDNTLKNISFSSANDLIESRNFVTPQKKQPYLSLSRKSYFQKQKNQLYGNLGEKSYTKIINKIFQFSSYKIKRDILKKKCLLYKNADIELGMITKTYQQKSLSKQPKIQVFIYITALANLGNLQVRINNNEISSKSPKKWLELISIQDKNKKRLLAQQQVTVKCIFKLLSQQFNIQQLSILPELYTRYIKQQTKKLEEIKIKQVPIFITKFVDNMVLKSEDMNKIVSNTHNNLEELFRSFINVDVKILKNFDDFVRYFPYAAVMPNGKNYIAKLKLSNLQQERYLIIKIFQKNQIMISLNCYTNEHNKYQYAQKHIKHTNLDEIIFKGYCSLLGL